MKGGIGGKREVRGVDTSSFRFVSGVASSDRRTWSKIFCRSCQGERSQLGI